MVNVKPLSEENQPKIEYTASNFQIHRFLVEIGDRNVRFQVIKMLDSLLIFINSKNDMVLNDLTVSMRNRYDNLPIGTRLIGNFTDETSTIIACRLTKKLNKTVFISCNIAGDPLFMPQVEKQLYQEIKNRPEMF